MRKINIRGWRESDRTAFEGDYLRGEFWAPQLPPVSLQYSEHFLTDNDPPRRHILVATRDDRPIAKIIVFDIDPYSASGFVQICLASAENSECYKTGIELGESIKIVLHRGLGIRTLIAFALDEEDGSRRILESLGFERQFSLSRHAVWKGQERSRSLWIHRKEGQHEHV